MPSQEHVVRFRLGQGQDSDVIGVPATEVRKLVDQLGREPRQPSARETRRRLLRAVVEGRAAPFPCQLCGDEAQRTLEAIERLPVEDTSPPLNALRGRLVSLIETAPPPTSE